MVEASISKEDILDAATRIQEFCAQTPLVEFPELNTRVGGRLLIKCENLQVTGSFKIRGAINRLLTIPEEDRGRHVVARSSGNHGAAIAYCAKTLQLKATIVVPKGAPKTKLAQIRAFGAEIEIAENSDHAVSLTEEVVKKYDGLLVPPADDFQIVAGAASVGLEIIRQADVTLDAIAVCCSGGGLAAGCTLAAELLSPTTKICIVEPENMDKMARSISAGYPVRNTPGAKTICDALAGPIVGKAPLEVLLSNPPTTNIVSDVEVQRATEFAARELGLIVEPGGAVALAAVLNGKIPVSGKNVALTLTGRNVDALQACKLVHNQS